MAPIYVGISLGLAVKLSDLGGQMIKSRDGQVAVRTREDRQLLLRTLAEGYHGPSWHGPSLRRAFAGVHLPEAAWQPGNGRNSIWSLALHTAYAKHLVLGRLDRSLATRFPRRLDRPWWPQLPERLDERAWREDLALLSACHQRLIDAVATVPFDKLQRRRSRAAPGRSVGDEVLGLALHDVYHAGQVQLLRRLYAQARDRR